VGGDTGSVEDPRLTPGETDLLIDGLTDDVAFNWVLIHLGIRANPPPVPGPPSVADVDSAFSVLETMTQRGLVEVGHLEYLDGGPPGRLAPVKHIKDPLPEVRRVVLTACESGSDWEWSCWVVTTPLGDDLARQALAGR
jgi:hypothetical protein